jgi:AcrR family transcriptional regulator
LIEKATKRPRKKTAASAPRPTRAEQRDLTRKALIDAASDVVGQHGYMGATVTAITRRARVAQGTFYNYFESREDLFQQLLPALTRTMFDHIIAAAAGAKTTPAREEATLRAYFDFLHRVPSFYRILYEAETFAPAAYRMNVDMIARNYTRQLETARARGEIVGFTRRELEPVAFMLMGARHYLSMRNLHRGRAGRSTPDWVVKAYLKLIRGLYQP